MTPKEKAKQYKLEWQRKNSEKHRAQVAEYAKSKKGVSSSKERNARYNAAHPERKLLRDARKRAKERGIECTIEESDIVIPETCPALNIPLVKKTNSYSNSPSLDRIDTSKGYIKGNVWVISWRANRIKSDATLEELEKMVAALKKQKDNNHV